jgi:FkbM family methyltransferase
MLARLLLAVYQILGGSRWLQVPLLERLYLAAFFFYKRRFEDPFADLVRQRPDLFAGGHIIDVGANVGYTVSVFAPALTAPFRIFAFEPESVNFAVLQRVLKRRGLADRVTAVRAAAGATSGEARLAINAGHPGDHRVVSGGAFVPAEVVPMVAIDDYFAAEQAAQVRFVKIDVQGFELSVSRGMAGLLDRAANVSVAFEYSARDMREAGAGGDELLSFYKKRGFELRLIGRRGELMPATDQAIAAEHRRRGYGNLLAMREGVR